MRNALLVASAMAAALSMATIGGTAQAQETEQCFGVAKAGKNDCKAGAHSCAGQSTADADPASFIVLPAGTCEKLAGGSLTPNA